MKTRSELIEERSRILEDCQEKLRLADGSLSDEAAAEITSMMDSAERLTNFLNTDESVGTMLRQPADPVLQRIARGGMPEGGLFGEDLGPVFRDSDGRKLTSYSNRHMISPKRSDGELGAAIHNMLTGRIQNSQVGSTDTAGGYLLTPQMSGMIIDLARAASVCLKAGAMTLPMNTSEMSIARIDSDATAEWRSETVAVTASTMTFGRVNLKARTLACLVPVSVELLEDAANAPQLIEAAIGAMMGQMLDDAGLNGTGAGAEPTGIRHTTGINTQTSVGTPTAGAATYAKVTGAIKSILDANYPGDSSGLAWIQNPRDLVNWGSLADTTYQPLLAPPIVGAMKQYATTAMPATEVGGAESSAIIGDFSQLLFGMRTTGVQVQILDSGSAVDSASVTWNAASQLLKFIRVYLRADVAVLRPTWFTLLSGITTA